MSEHDEIWICDRCMAVVTRTQIADMADGEHVTCRSCWDAEAEA